MPRAIIPLVTGEYYHIYNRGVDKRTIFESRRDYLRFYQSLDIFNSIEPVQNLRDGKYRVHLPKNRLIQLHAYALLPNHFHLIVEQLVDGGVSEFMKRVQGGYTTHFNEHHERSGALLQGKFKRIHIDSEEYLQYLRVYVNENHWVHQIVPGSDIFYSSSQHYQGSKTSKLLPQITESYDVELSRKLAQDIATKREILKTET